MKSKETKTTIVVQLVMVVVMEDEINESRWIASSPTVASAE